MIREIILLISISVIGQIVLFYISLETHFHIRGKKKEIKTLSEEFPNKEKEKYIYYSLGGEKYGI